MKKFSLTLFVALAALMFTLASPVFSLAAEEERKEVEQRLELNNVSAEELAATGAVSKELAEKIIELREQLGSFQTYDDLNELKIPAGELEKLQINTTIQGIAADCTC